MENEELDVSEDGGSTSVFALSVARGNNACPPVEEMARGRGPPNSVSRQKLQRIWC